MKSILILAASMLISGSVLANTEVTHETNSTEIVKMVQLTGSIMDDKNKETLVGATVYVDGKKYYSDLDGNFSISNIKPGKYQVKVELISYESAIVEIDVDNNEGVNIFLHQN